MRGICLCGPVQYEVKGTPTAFDLCHCSRCREASGSAFVAELVFKAAQFEWVTGGSLVKTYAAPVRMKPPGYRRTFCEICGGPLPTVDRDVIRILAGTLDGDPELRPQRHIFVDSRLPGSRSPMDCRALRQSRRSDSRFAVSTRLAPVGRPGYAHPHVWRGSPLLRCERDQTCWT